MNKNIVTLFMVVCIGSLQAQTPRDLKIAFLADAGMEEKTRVVLRLIKAEGADAVVHQGDMAYSSNVTSWNQMITEELGENFPYFCSLGNHDTGSYESYKSVLEARAQRAGVSWFGDIVAKGSVTYKGIFILLTAPDVRGSGHADFITQQLATNDAIWSITSWHKNQREMQVGGKGDATGWEVYEAARIGGAIIATGHEHSYSRTHLLSNCETQTVASTSDTLVISEGETFVFVNGLGGRSNRPQRRDGPWWASIYTTTQGAVHAVLFGIFNRHGDPRLAEFYLKAINGDVPDRFWVRSEVGLDSPGGVPNVPTLVSVEIVE